ncbi:MAG: c-type cytochrome [Bacteroidota bacterium]
MKYVLIVIASVCWILSCGRAPKADLVAGKQTYLTYCQLCHGEDGKLGLNDSKDLTKSVVSFEEAINQVTNGKGLMVPYKDILTKEEISNVVHYVISMRE